MPQPAQEPRSTPRSDITALVVALRDGASYDQLREFLPGFTPDSMMRAYTYLQRRRAESQEAWDAIVAKPGAVSLTQHGMRAAMLLPVAVADIWRVANSAHGVEAIEHMVNAAAHRIDVDTTYTQEVEDDLSLIAHSTTRRLRIGSELFQPQHDCLWSGPYYMPRRITDLSPLRVMDLLGERTR